MLKIACPACAAEFSAPASAIPPGGRTLKCSVCGHLWHYGDLTAKTETMLPLPPELPPDGSVSPVPDHLQAIETPSFLSTAAPSAPTMGHFPDLMPGSMAPATDKVSIMYRYASLAAGYAAAFVVFVGMIYLLATGQAVVTGLFPRAQAAYDLFGAPMVLGQPDLMFDQVTFTAKDATLTITGNIKNQDSMQKNVLPVRVALIGNARPEPLTIWVFRPEKNYINPGEVVPFTLTRPFGRSDEITKISLSFIEN